jgi:hypothetical protein
MWFAPYPVIGHLAPPAALLRAFTGPFPLSNAPGPPFQRLKGATDAFERGHCAMKGALEAIPERVNGQRVWFAPDAVVEHLAPPAAEALLLRGARPRYRRARLGTRGPGQVEPARRQPPFHLRGQTS